MREGRHARTEMLATHDERVPEQHQIARDAKQPAVVEELRLSVRPMEVVHRHFDDAEAPVLDLLHHLDTDDAARLLEIDALEDRSPHQTEVAVDVAQPESEQQADDVVIYAADDDAVERTR